MTLQHLIAASAHKSFDIRATGHLSHVFPQVSWFNVDLLNDNHLNLFFLGCRHLLISFSHTKDLRERYLQSNAILEAAKRQNVSMISMLSVAGADNSTQEWHAHEFRQLERVIEASSIPYCFVRASLFMENLLLFSEQVMANQGKIEFPLGKEGRAPFIALDDVGRFCAALLLAKQKYAETAWTLTGDKDYSGREIAQVFSEVLRRPIAYSDASEARAREIMQQGSVPEWEQDRFIMWAKLIGTGSSNLKCTDALYRVTGHRAMTLMDWVKSMESRFGAATPFPGIPVRGNSVIREGFVKGSLFHHDDEAFPGFVTKQVQ